MEGDPLRTWLFLLCQADHLARGYLFSSDEHADMVEFKYVAAARQERHGH